MAEDNDTYVETSETGYLSRLGNSFKGILMGIVLVVVATGLLYWNEGRSVRAGDAIAEAKLAMVEMPSPAQIDSSLEGQLVHACGRADTKDVLTDSMFPVKATAISISRKAEFYQWVESSETKKQQKLGGGEETVTTYKYERKWVSSPVDSSSFKKKEGHANTVKANVDSSSQYAQNVTFGAYRLPDFLIRSVGGARPLPVSLTDAQIEALQKEIFPEQAQQIQNAGYSYGTSFVIPRMVHARQNTIYIGVQENQPEIGDVRVSFTQVLPADVSLIAKVNGDSFEKFVASNGNKFSEFSMGRVSADVMFKSAEDTAAMITWGLRILGVILCVAGLNMILAPLSVLASVIPMLGSIVGAGTGIVAGLIGFAWSLIVIAISWIRFRPMLAGALLGAAAVLIIAVFFLKKQKAPAKAA